MKTKLKTFYYACREICFGSGRISILSILLTTTVLYCLFFIFFNSTLLPLVLGTISKTTDYHTTKTYLDNLRIHTEMSILVPIISTIIVLIPPTNQLKSNILNRLLPISAWTRISAFIFIILISTTFSFIIVQVLEYSIIQYFRGKYMQQVIALQEKFGDLYRYYLPNSDLFSPNYTPRFKTLHDWRSIFILSLVFNIILLVFNIYFNKHGIIKGITLMLIVLYIASNIRTILLKNGDQTMQINSFTYETVYFIYFPLILMLFLFAFYFLLKQKES